MQKKMRKEKIVAVLAGSAKQFQEFTQSYKTENVKFIYVYNTDLCRGLKIDDYVKVGTFYENPKWSEIIDYLEARSLHKLIPLTINLKSLN